jgi:hypothetical protein
VWAGSPCADTHTHTPRTPRSLLPPSGTWALIDLGLARRYVDESGAHAAPRGDASFRGSTTYASVHAHRQQDLSRRDDLWSWFYLLVECVDGEQESGRVVEGVGVAGAAQECLCCLATGLA